MKGGLNAKPRFPIFVDKEKQIWKLYFLKVLRRDSISGAKFIELASFWSHTLVLSMHIFVNDIVNIYTFLGHTCEILLFR